MYGITEEGRKVLREWLADPTGELPELRDPGTLKLFFGNFGSPDDVVRLAENQVRMYEAQGREHEEIAAQFKGVTGIETQLATLRCGMAVNEACLGFWRTIAIFEAAVYTYSCVPAPMSPRRRTRAATPAPVNRA